MVTKIFVYDRDEFRSWLNKNHEKESKVSVILYKRHTGKDAPSHKELMEEAICYGWIDTTIKRIDDNKYIRNFSKRNEKSRWSDNTLRYGRELIEKGKMTSEGLKFYKLGLIRPVVGHGIPKNPSMPSDLRKQLLKNKKIKNNFEKLTPSTKKMLYRWILSGKLVETRNKRVSRIITMIKEGKKNIY